jgi:hypothetical protein
MSVFSKQVCLALPLREALSVIGCHALGEGRQEAAAEIAKLANELGDTVGTISVDGSAVFAALCDSLRAAGEVDAVARVERIIKLLKQDLPQIVVVGSIGYHVQSARQLDQHYEQLRRKVADAVGE